MKKPISLLLFSGGLDSILAYKILQQAKIRTILITFTSAFFNSQQAQKSAKSLKAKLIIKDISKKHLKIVNKPQFGYGKNLNPCIDCHRLMLKEAHKILKIKHYDFLATGEVLGQRPFSQNKQALLLIEKTLNLNQQILRPLSAQLLPPTLMEQQGLIKKNKFFKIQGKSRKEQLILAKKFKINYFPTPAGGCILTDINYSAKLKKLFQLNLKNQIIKDIQAIKIGRFYLLKNSFLLLGRNALENNLIEKLNLKNQIIIKLKNIPGPTAILRFFKPFQKNRSAIAYAKKKILHFTKKANNSKKIDFMITK